MKHIVYKNSKIVHGILNQISRCWKNSSGEIAERSGRRRELDNLMRGGITMGQPTIHLLKSCVACVAREASWCTMPALPLKAFECPPHFCLSAAKKLKTCSPAIHYPGPIRYRCRSCEWNIGISRRVCSTTLNNPPLSLNPWHGITCSQVESMDTSRSSRPKMKNWWKILWWISDSRRGS